VQLFHYHLVTSRVREVEARYIGKLAFDLVARHDFTERVRQVARAGTTLILITHHIEEIVPEIQRIILVGHGKIAASGSTREILTSARISALFDAPIALEEEDGYYYARPTKEKV